MDGGPVAFHLPTDHHYSGGGAVFIIRVIPHRDDQAVTPIIGYHSPMPATRKKAIALLTTAAGLGILLVAGVVLYRPLEERYWAFSTDVNLPKEHEVRFPDKCVVCSHSSV